MDSLPRMASLETMFERTITIMSAGKIFSATGIRVGWGIGPKNFIQKVAAVHQYNSFCLYDPIQLAIAECLDVANEPYEGYDNYYQWLRATYSEKRAYLCQKFEQD